MWVDVNIFNCKVHNPIRVCHCLSSLLLPLTYIHLPSIELETPAHRSYCPLILQGLNSEPTGPWPRHSDSQFSFHKEPPFRQEYNEFFHAQLDPLWSICSNVCVGGGGSSVIFTAQYCLFGRCVYIHPKYDRPCRLQLTLASIGQRHYAREAPRTIIIKTRTEWIDTACRVAVCVTLQGAARKYIGLLCW